MAKEKQLREFADQGNIKGIHQLLMKQANPNGQDSFGFTALEYAMNSYPHIPNKDHLGVVKALVNGGADVNAKARNGQSPLFTAAAEGLYEVVRFLHHNGADLNARLDTGANAFFDISDGIINRPLNYQVSIRKDGKTINLIDPDEIRQATGSHPDDEFYARLNTAKYLVKNGIDLNAQLHESGQTALFRASDLGAFEIVELILSEGKVDPNHADKWGLRALHYASRRGHFKIVEILIAAGSEMDAQEVYGFTPLHEAAENGHLEIVRLLIESGADSLIGLERAYQNYPKGSTPFDIAKIAKQSSIIKYLSGIQQ